MRSSGAVCIGRGVLLAAALMAPLAASADLVGLWTFDGNANPQPDSAGYGNHAGVSNNVAWTNAFDGRVGVMRFGGAAGDRLQAPHSASLSLTGNLSMAAWVRLNGWSTYRLVCKTAANMPAPFDWSVSGGYPNLYRGNGSAYGNFAYAPGDTSMGTEVTVWRQVVVTVSGTVITHYIDGEAVTNGVITAAVGDAGHPVWIGLRMDANSPFNGYMDDVAMWNECLTPAQVRSAYLYGAANYNLALAWPADAYIVKPVDLAVTKIVAETYGGNYALYNPIYAIDGSGLSDLQVVRSGQPVPASWPTHGNSTQQGWRSHHLVAGTNGFMLFDLGAVYPVYGLHAWNGSSQPAWSPNLLDIQVSVTGTGVRDATNYPFTTLATFPIPKVRTPASYPGMDYIFAGGSVTARFVRLKTRSLYTEGITYQEFSEVRFVAAPRPAVTGTRAGDTIVKPTAISVPTQSGSYLGVHAIDGSGLDDAAAVETGRPAPATWPSHTNNGDTVWMTMTGDITPTTVLDLGRLYMVRGFHLWNMNWCGGTGNYYYWVPDRAFRRVRVSIATAGTGLGDAGPFTTVTMFPDTSVAVPAGFLPYRGDDYLFADGPSRARFVKIECLANRRDEVYGSGLAEIRFIIPPPSSSVVLIR